MLAMPMPSLMSAQGTLHKFFSTIESKYRGAAVQPYHNNIHAADVLHSSHVMLDENGLMDCLSDLEIFAVLVAAASHDVEHPGYTNTFLVWHAVHGMCLMWPRSRRAIR